MRMPAWPNEQAADDDEEAAEPGQQDRGLEGVAEHLEFLGDAALGVGWGAGAAPTGFEGTEGAERRHQGTASGGRVPLKVSGRVRRTP